MRAGRPHFKCGIYSRLAPSLIQLSCSLPTSLDCHLAVSSPQRLATKDRSLYGYNPTLRTADDPAQDRRFSFDFWPLPRPTSSQNSATRTADSASTIAQFKLKMTNISYTFVTAQTGTATTGAWEVISRLHALLAPSSLELLLARETPRPPDRNTSRIISVSKTVKVLIEYFPAPLSLPRVPVLHPPLSTLESGHCQMIGRFFFPIQPGPPTITSKKTTISHQVSILPSVPPDHISTRRAVLRTGWRHFLRVNRPLKPSSPWVLSNLFPHLSKNKALI